MILPLRITEGSLVDWTTFQGWREWTVSLDETNLALVVTDVKVKQDVKMKRSVGKSIDEFKE